MSLRSDQRIRAAYQEGSGDMGHEQVIARIDAHIAELDLWDADPSGGFENLAAEFYEQTGLLAPGKSVPLEMSHVSYDDERKAAWNTFREERAKRMNQGLLREAREALSASVGENEKLKAARRIPELDNHHNAAACPYCRPDLEAKIQRHRAIVERAEQAEAALADARQEVHRVLDEAIPEDCRVTVRESIYASLAVSVLKMRAQLSAVHAREQRVRALTDTWRQAAKEELIERGPSWVGASSALNGCADDLEAALSSETPEGTT